MIDGPLHADAAVLAALGERLERRRLERNRSQSELAREAGVSKRTVERIEAGESTQLSNLVRILRALGLLERLELLVPASLPSPIDQLKLRRRQRRRATGARGASGPARQDGVVGESPSAASPPTDNAAPPPAREWRWGDEPTEGGSA
jgi:transcriptional regulator with XRE-family HTH domain